MGKILILIGLFVSLIGLLIWGGGKMGIPFGQLPGDVHYQKDNFSFYFPITTTLLISVLISLLINVAFWLFKR